jgi:rhamnogalacturonan endolyase
MTRGSAATLTSFVLFTSAACAADLFRDDFSRFPPGQLSTPVGELNGAIQEYHYLAHRGVPLGPWANAIAHLDAWAISDEDGTAYLEQHLTADARQFSFPIFLTGDPEWSSYAVEARVKPLSLVYCPPNSLN